MRKLLTLREKTLAVNGARTLQELWAKAKEAGYQGMVMEAEAAFVKAAEGDTYHAVFSTASVDRHGEIVYQNFDLRSFKRNPVFLDSHNYDSIENILGSVLNPTVRSGQLEGDIKFAHMNPRGLLAQQLVEAGHLSATSIGFIPLEFDDKGNITKSELLEISAVSVPANPEALIGERKEMGDQEPAPESAPAEQPAEDPAPAAEEHTAPEPQAAATTAADVARALRHLAAHRRQCLAHVASEVHMLVAPGARKRALMQELRDLLNA